ncbi:AAA ATPase midasin [Desmophyllum pertusum]|uniref:AAA ATPase midasin n=1 Tax=Desmophyllum pertusum TaxID=174260 RepID=A0A9W9ZUG0_9CNID|nr:AAA ATPase midasin [Desmophyllum pertusum]
MKQIVAPVRETFEVLFCKTFSRKQNVKFLSHVQKCFAQGQWEMLFKLMVHCQKNALERVKKDHQMNHLISEWINVNQDIQQLRKQQKNAESALAFRFVEGTLVQALRNGDWVLLDEINLATPETLECLCGLLESSSGSVVLMERGDITPTTGHEDFRLFACMNPATDVGKKDLPPGIRNRFYLTVKHEANDKLTDGLLLSFLTQLDRSSHPAVQSLIRQHLLGHVNPTQHAETAPTHAARLRTVFCNFEGFWIAMGNKEPVVSTEYVLTASVRLT